MKKEYEATNYESERHFIGIRPFRRDVQMAVIEGHFGILLMNFTISELIFLCESKSKKGFRFSQNAGLLNALSHGETVHTDYQKIMKLLVVLLKQ